MNLPDDIIYTIVLNANIDDIMNLYNTNHQYKNVLNQPHVLSELSLKYLDKPALTYKELMMMYQERKTKLENINKFANDFLPTDGETLRYNNLNYKLILPFLDINMDYDKFAIWFGPNTIIIYFYKMMDKKYTQIFKKRFILDKINYKKVFVNAVYYNDNFYNTYV